MKKGEQKISNRQNDNAKKKKSLREQKALNHHPERVQDELFKNNDFFDPKDMVQIKYEMLRRVRIEGWNVKAATQAFGFSRPSFYKAQRDFESGGLVGLLPQKGGPKGAHKLIDDIMDFIEETMGADEALRAPRLVILIKEKFGIDVHPRSIERALFRRKKNQGGNI